jgi:hypothetical protein
VYVEIISFNKSVDDAKEHNAVPFEKIGLGSGTMAIVPSGA